MRKALGKRMFGMFPETLCADVTMGTNAEKRPLLVMTAKTSENQIVRVFQAFLPSQCAGFLIGASVMHLCNSMEVPLLSGIKLF